MSCRKKPCKIVFLDPINILNSSSSKIEAKRTLHILHLRKSEAKQILFIPQIRKIEAERTLFIPQIGQIEAKQSLFIQQFKRTKWSEVKRNEEVCLLHKF